MILGTLPSFATARPAASAAADASVGAPAALEDFTAILDAVIRERRAEAATALRRIVTLAISWGIPCPALSASLSYYDSMRTERLTANLIQAQRDFFGAHTYVRLDDPSLNVHTEWMQTS